MKKQVDLTLKVVIVSIILTVLLAVSNTYLALKVGLLTAASIPAAILSMGIMRFFKESTMYEHNLVQTAASSGEAIAGGIGYTLPALIIIGFMHSFNYVDTAAIAFIGGVIGVLFSAMIRRPLLDDPSLRFPEAQAISEVLKLKERQELGFKAMIFGALAAALVEFCQSTGVMFSGGTDFAWVGSSLLGFGLGLSPALIGAGYIVGARVGLSILIGAILSYLIILPCMSHGLLVSGKAVDFFNANEAMNMRYVGVGGMLCAAVLTLLRLLKPLCQNLAKTLGHLHLTKALPLHEQDLSRKTIRFGLIACLLVLGLLLTHLFGLSALGFGMGSQLLAVGSSVLFILLIGFIVSIVSGYFSGLVGVSASPGSSILIAVLILAGLLVHAILGLGASHTDRMIGEAMTIIIASVMMQIACIANDTMQDLKVGQVIGASPRKQQMMLIFGALIASLIVPAVMQVLYAAYGIAGHMPRPLMDASQSLAAPPAAIIAALTATIFNGVIPVKLLAIGAGAVLVLACAQYLILKRFALELSLIAVGIGMYLPLSSSTPLMIGALLSLFALKRSKILLACGLVTGATLMDVILAVPIALNPQGQALSFSVGLPLSVSAAGIGLMVLFWAFLKK